MTKKWRIADLDFAKAREYITSQDPDISLRFFLPVPNWLKDGKPIVDDENIKRVQKKDGAQWRYTFINYKDNAEQGVKIDGSAAIVFMGADKKKAEQLKDMIAEYVSDTSQLTPAILSEILKRSKDELGLVDRYNKGLNGLQYFHAYNADGQYGAFLPHENPSAAIYIEGDGEFLDGPTLTPQKFENGAFINFPGKRLSDLFEGPAEGRLVQADVFVKDRENLDGSKIDLAAVPK